MISHWFIPSVLELLHETCLVQVIQMNNQLVFTWSTFCMFDGDAIGLTCPEVVSFDCFKDLDDVSEVFIDLSHQGNRKRML